MLRLSIAEISTHDLPALTWHDVFDFHKASPELMELTGVAKEAASNFCGFDRTPAVIPQYFVDGG